VYATYVPGLDPAIAVNAAGEVFVASLASPPVTLIQLNAAGTTVLFSRRFGGSGFNRVSAIALDAQSNVYLAGVTNDPQFPTTPGALSTTFKGLEASYLLKFNPRTSQILYSTFLGQSAVEFVGVGPNPGGASFFGAGGLAVDSDGNAYVAGTTSDPNFPITPGAPTSSEVT